jgi:hypothetical protein
MQNLNNDTTQLTAIQATVNNLLVEARRDVPDPAVPPTITTATANASGGVLIASDGNRAVLTLSKTSGDGTVYVVPGGNDPTTGNYTYSLVGNAAILKVSGSEATYAYRGITSTGTCGITLTAMPRVT